MKVKIKGKVSTISIGEGGVPKHPVSKPVTITKVGIQGDSCKNTKYHGGKHHPDQAVCLYSQECYANLGLEGISLEPGYLGENFTTEGLDYNLLRPGDILRVGKNVTLKVTKARQPCKTIGNAYGMGLLKLMWEKGFDHPTVEQFNTSKWGMSGFYAEVIQEGTVKPGDTIERIIYRKPQSDNTRK